MRYHTSLQFLFPFPFLVFFSTFSQPTTPPFQYQLNRCCFSLCRYSISVHRKRIGIDWESIIFSQDKHFQNYYIKLCPVSYHWVLTGWLYLVLRVLHQKFKQNHWYGKQSGTIYLIAYTFSNNSHENRLQMTFISHRIMILMYSGPCLWVTDHNRLSYHPFCCCGQAQSFLLMFVVLLTR